LLCSDVRSEKKQIIAENMRLTDTEAEKFWPVHDAHTQENDTLTDAQADDLAKRMAALEVQAATSRQQWIPRFRKVVPGKQTALFFQLDRRVNLLIDLQLAAMIPVVK
jgi:hypothetical protein